MGEVRSCDARCHNAELPKCSCWCGGLFHGVEGRAAREAFVQEYGGELPQKLEDFQAHTEGTLPFAGATASGDRWQRAVAAARAARGD